MPLRDRLKGLAEATALVGHRLQAGKRTTAMRPHQGMCRSITLSLLLWWAPATGREAHRCRGAQQAARRTAPARPAA